MIPKLGRKIAAAGLAVLLFISAIVFFFAGSLNRVQANEWGCLFGGGLFEDKGLKEVIAPGKSGGFTVFDTLITLPSDDRIYAIDTDPNTADFGGLPIIVPAKGTSEDNNGIVQVNVPVQARFTINENACDLYQNYLKKYKAEGLHFNRTDSPSDPGGWAKFLNLQMNQTMITSIRSQISGKTYVDLYTNFTQYPELQKNVSAALSASLRSSLGGDFFCGPSYTFDGKADGRLDGAGCPPIEIIIKVIEPTDPQFLSNLKTIVANQEQQKVIESNKDKIIAQTQADKEQSLAATEAERDKSLAATAAEQETQLAETEKDKTVALAKALADEEVALAFVPVAQAETANSLERAKAETAFCERLAAAGVSCADYFKAINWKPSVILGEDGGALPLINVDVPEQE